MGDYIRVISQIKPQNDSTAFPLADVNDLQGGYVQVETLSQMNSIPTRKIHQGMLCYVKETGTIYQNYNGLINSWNVWKGSSGSGGSVISVDTLSDLNSVQYKVRGTIAYVTETDDLRWYNGSNWYSFTKIYIQNVQPEDTSGIWIDTQEDKKYNTQDTVIQNLLESIAILQNKVKQFQYAFDCQMDFGDLSNNKYYEYNGATELEPGTTAETVGTTTSDTGEPVGYSSLLPNCRHLKIKAGTEANRVKYKDDFVGAELIWCTDTHVLWIKNPTDLKMYVIGSSGGDDPGTTDEIMNGILQNTGKTYITGIEFEDITNSKNHYILQVQDGKLDFHNMSLDTNSLAANNQGADTDGDGYYSQVYWPITTSFSNSPRIFINMFYCGGDSDKYSFNPVSHNFIELSNLNNEDLNLYGMFLHYNEIDAFGANKWITLPLKGTIPAHGTFLIKGAPCSDYNANTTYIKVEEPDMYWTKSATLDYSNIQPTCFDDNGYIKMHTICSLYLSGSDTDTFNYNKVAMVGTPIANSQVFKYYVDLVGVGTSSSSITQYNEKSALSSAYRQNAMWLRYYAMDMVSQANKVLASRSNATDWTYFDFSRISSPGYSGIDFTKYYPKNSTQNKTIFYDKNLLSDTIVTCNFGYNAHTTRCFTWMSRGIYNEYIWIRKTGQTDWQQFESFNSNDFTGTTANRPTIRPITNDTDYTRPRNWDNSIYNRIKSITTDGTAFTVHKFMINFCIESASSTNTYVTNSALLFTGDSQEYQYRVGRDLDNATAIRTFTLRSRASVITNGFKFTQVTDQQGFNSEEYKVWELSADIINNGYTGDFVINTGDATQNGNRINEWVDYFKAGDYLFNHLEQMYTVGNNDLCPLDVYTLGDGDDLSKNNPINVQYFFTYEYPIELPITWRGDTTHEHTYIPSTYTFIYGDTYFVSMNSEITDIAINGVSDSAGNLTQSPLYNSDSDIYNTSLKEWLLNDVTNSLTDTNIKWRVAFCHEAPFTLITKTLINSYLTTDTTTGTITANSTVVRGGSHLNLLGNYWFSQFLQDTGLKDSNNNIVSFKLCICGHKHTYSESRLLHEDKDHTMAPIIYEPSLTAAEWYTTLVNSDSKVSYLCQLSDSTTIKYVKYVMCQATGYKLISNKELPARDIPWLKNYYPISATDAVNGAQKYPHFIVWSIGSGNETETPGTNKDTSRSRILGQVWKIKPTTKSIAYSHNNYLTKSDVTVINGNGESGNTQIIVE